MITVNIPHSSIYIPKNITFSIPDDSVKYEALLMADLFTDELIEDSHQIETIKANVSRIVVDTERFVDDNQEVASQFGMGVIYTKTHDGKQLKKVPTNTEKEELLHKFYYPHHLKLEQHVQQNLEHYHKALIIDLHSYPTAIDILGIGEKNTPDICIGFEEPHCDPKLLTIITNFCKDNGLSYELNNPFSGAIVPLSFYKKNTNVVSFMLEIKKSLYMNEYTFQKNSNFNNLKLKLNKLLDCLYNNFYGDNK